MSYAQYIKEIGRGAEGARDLSGDDAKQLYAASAAAATRLTERVRAVAARTYDFSELLVDVLGVTDVGAYFPHRVTYHPTCHSLRVARVGDRPYRLLKAVRGIDLVELPEAEQCCGFGGTFAIKNADTSMAMLGDKLRCVLDTRAEVAALARLRVRLAALGVELPIAADESIRRAEDPLRVAREEAADLVVEMTRVKHPSDVGPIGQGGIEW